MKKLVLVLLTVLMCASSDALAGRRHQHHRHYTPRHHYQHHRYYRPSRYRDYMSKDLYRVGVGVQIASDIVDLVNTIRYTPAVVEHQVITQPVQTVPVPVVEPVVQAEPLPGYRYRFNHVSGSTAETTIVVQPQEHPVTIIVGQ